MKTATQYEIEKAVEMIRALKLRYVQANKPASFLVRAESNIAAYYARGEYNKCLEVIEETCNKL